MGYENWKIEGFLMAFLMVFLMLFPGWHAMKNLIRCLMKIALNSFENPLNRQEQDLHGFLVYGECQHETLTHLQKLLTIVSVWEACHTQSLKFWK